MEEKKLDINSIIGFLLIGGILLYMLWQNQPTPEQLAEQEEAKQEQLATEAANQTAAELTITDNSSNNQLPTDSLGLASLKNKIGDFAYALTLPSATNNITTFENEVLALKIDNKGGFISEVKLKSYVNHDSVPVYLIKDGSSVFNLNLLSLLYFDCKSSGILLITYSPILVIQRSLYSRMYRIVHRHQ